MFVNSSFDQFYSYFLLREKNFIFQWYDIYFLFPPTLREELTINVDLILIILNFILHLSINILKHYLAEHTYPSLSTKVKMTRKGLILYQHRYYSNTIQEYLIEITLRIRNMRRLRNRPYFSGD